MDADEQQDSGIDGDLKSPRFPRTQTDNDENVLNSSRTSSVSSFAADKDSEYSTPTKTTRDLNRKLEMRIAKARGLHSQEQKQGACLLPFQRIPVPRKIGHVLGNPENSPLVDWQSDSSESDDIEFFPSFKLDKKQGLTDTFSVDNLELSDDDDLNLNIAPLMPNPRWNCCSSQSRCSLM